MIKNLFINKRVWLFDNKKETKKSCVAWTLWVNSRFWAIVTDSLFISFDVIFCFMDFYLIFFYLLMLFTSHLGFILFHFFICLDLICDVLLILMIIYIFIFSNLWFLFSLNLKVELKILVRIIKLKNLSLLFFIFCNLCNIADWSVELTTKPMSYAFGLLQLLCYIWALFGAVNLHLVIIHSMFFC